MCGIFERVMAEEEFKALQETRTQVEQLFLAASVEAALVTDPRSNTFEIAARVEEGVLSLSGPYLKEAEVKTVMEIAATAPGVEKVRYTPGYAPTLDVQR
jgi:osmotically-inducible protein OsmY